MLPTDLHDAVERILSKRTGGTITINQASSLSGGSINYAYRLETNSGKYFFKYNRASAYPEMFEQEARGLELLHDADEVRVPEVITAGEEGNHSFLLLEYLDSSAKRDDFWEVFGRRLAALHRHTTSSFGLDHDNYIGSLKQYNRKHNNWLDFFREERLMVQIEMNGLSSLHIDAPVGHG